MAADVPVQVDLRLDADDALALVHLLLGMATLIDPDDPGGLPNLSFEARASLLLSTEQLAWLHRPARFREVERESLARELRRLSATVEGQIG
jgi:hypothetical protein